MKIGLGLHLPITGQDKIPAGQLYAPPTLNSITPDHGPFTGGTLCTLRGSDFTAGTQVSFGLTWVMGTLVDSQTMMATSPGDPAGVAAMSLTAADGQFCNGPNFTYDPPPVVTGIVPNTGPAAGGTAITDLQGTGFLNDPGPPAVTFDGVPATGVVWVSATRITCVTPAHAAGAVDVVVTNPDAQNSGATGAGLFTYL